MPIYNTKDINSFQQEIMDFISNWVKTEKTPVPYGKILIEMKSHDIERLTVLKAIQGLIEKKYIRKAVTGGNKTYYVQLRW